MTTENIWLQPCTAQRADIRQILKPDSVEDIFKRAIDPRDPDTSLDERSLLQSMRQVLIGHGENLSRYDLSARVDYLEFPTQVRAMIGLAPDISQKQEIPEGENIWY